MALQTAGLTNPYTAGLLQNQTLLTNVAYINDEGQVCAIILVVFFCHPATGAKYTLWWASASNLAVDGYGVNSLVF